MPKNTPEKILRIFSPLRDLVANHFLGFKSVEKRLILLLLPLALLAGCNDPAEKRAEVSLPAVQVQTETLELSDVPFQVEVAGTLKAVEHAMISSRVSGQIVKLPVRIGSQVKSGDLLVELSAAEINAKLRRAETQLAQVRRNFERETKLLEAQASTPEKVKTLNEQVAMAEAGYREAKAMLDYTRIRAPFAATVTRKLAEVGDLAAPGSPLLQLENSAALEVLIQVPEALSQGLVLDEELPVTIPAAGVALQAAIREISPTVDPATRTTQVKLTLPDNRALRSGQFARVALPDRKAKTLLVPASALVLNGQMEQVFVAVEGRAQLRLVRSGTHHGEQVEILSGLEAGDRVVVDAVSRLHDGQPLEIVAVGQEK